LLFFYVHHKPKAVNLDEVLRSKIGSRIELLPWRLALTTKGETRLEILITSGSGPVSGGAKSSDSQKNKFDGHQRKA